MLHSPTAPTVDVPIATRRIVNGTLSIHTLGNRECFAEATALTQHQGALGQPVCVCPPTGAHDERFQEILDLETLGTQLGPHYADGVITTHRPVIMEARDCAVLVLWDTNCPAILVCHIGRDGLVPHQNGGTSVSRAVAALKASGATTSQIRAWIGPTICQHCFQHDDEEERTVAIRDAFQTAYPAHFAATTGGIDMPRILANLLMECGVGQQRIVQDERCTAGDTGLASRRRDGPAAKAQNYTVVIPAG